MLSAGQGHHARDSTTTSLVSAYDVKRSVFQRVIACLWTPVHSDPDSRGSNTDISDLYYRY